MSETTAIDTVESVSSPPADEPTDAAGPSSGLSLPKISAPAPVVSALAATPPTADAFIQHLFRCVQTRAGADVVLLFLCYTARLTGSALESLSRTALRHSARKLVALAFQLPPSTTVVLSSTPAPPAATFALQLAARFKALTGLLSEWRMMNRLFGLLGLYFSAKKLIAQSLAKSKNDPEKKELSLPSSKSSEERFDTILSYAQIIALISYQFTENVAYLSSKKVLGFSPATQAKLGRWSVRSWALYIGMELGRLLVERSRKTKAVDATGKGVDPASKAAHGRWAQEWRTSFSRNVAWAPLTVHWSIDNGPLSDLAVGLLAFYPASGYMRDLWKSNA